MERGKIMSSKNWSTLIRIRLYRVFLYIIFIYFFCIIYVYYHKSQFYSISSHSLSTVLIRYAWDVNSILKSTNAIPVITRNTILMNP
jgi:hypothetical protein